jgi:acyl-CoA thioesterase
LNDRSINGNSVSNGLHQRTRPRGSSSSEGDPVGTDEKAAEVAAAMLAAEGTGPAWGVEIEAAREGYSRVRMRLRPDMMNGHGTAHGGMIFALADTAFAYACNSRNVRTVAAQASIVFLAAAEAGEWLVAEAEEQALGGRSGVYIVAVRGEDGRAIASFQGLSRSLGGAVIAETNLAGE